MKFPRLLKTKCEGCGFKNTATVRTGEKVNIGWQCPACGYYNVLVEKYNSK